MEVTWKLYLDPWLICLMISISIILSVFLGMFISELMINRDIIQNIIDFLGLLGINTLGINEVRRRRNVTRRDILIWGSFLIVCFCITLLYYILVIEIFTVFQKNPISDCPNN